MINSDSDKKKYLTPQQPETIIIVGAVGLYVKNCHHHWYDHRIL